MPHPYDDWDQVHSFPYGQVAYDLDLSPDGKTLAVANHDGAIRLYEMAEAAPETPESEKQDA